MFLGILSCKEALARLDDYVDRRLSEDETRLVARHLKICAHCAQKFAFETELVEGLRQKIGHIEAPPQLLDKIRASLEGSSPDGRPENFFGNSTDVGTPTP